MVCTLPPSCPAVCEMAGQQDPHGLTCEPVPSAAQTLPEALLTNACLPLWVGGEKPLLPSSVPLKNPLEEKTCVLTCNFNNRVPLNGCMREIGCLGIYSIKIQLISQGSLSFWHRVE